MINVAFSLPYDREKWIGGYNYILNIMISLSMSKIENIRPVLFIGDDVDSDSLVPFSNIKNVLIVREPYFNRKKKSIRLLVALLTGKDFLALRIFKSHNINVVFETAQFHGISFNIPIISWIPDFQHKHMPEKFNFYSYWKREFGFKLQTSTRRAILLSSEDARNDCEKFYPKSINFTNVAHFAIFDLTKNNSKKDFDDLCIKYSIPKSFFFLPNQFWTHKNHITVIEALKILKTKNLDITIVSTGAQSDPRNVNYFQELVKKIEDYGILNSIKILGLIPYKDINLLLLNCKALINPSFFEGWSTTVEEGKSTKTPLILSSIAVHIEQSCDNAFFFDPNSPQELAFLLEKYSAYSRTELQKILNLSNTNYELNLLTFINRVSEVVIKVAQK